MEAFSGNANYSVASIPFGSDHNMKQACAGSYSIVLDEIKDETNRFQEATFIHESRFSNMEAHRLARASVSSSIGRQVCLYGLPTVYVFLTMFYINKVPCFP